METFSPSREVTKQSIILGIYFMLTYLTYLSFANIITYIAQHQQGQYDYAPVVALALNYFVYMVTLIFSPAITNFKKQFQISAICHLINYAVYIPDLKGDWGLIMGIIGALFGGYGAAIYWVSQGGYMMKLFKMYGIKTNEEGKYFGITNAIVYGSSFFGAIVTTFGLGLFGSQIYFSILTVLALVSWAVCTFFLDSLQKSKGNCSLITQSDTLIEKQTVLAEQNKKIDLQFIKSIFIKTISYYPKMYYLYALVVLDGIIAGFISIYLNKLLPEDIRTDLNVGYILMVEGVGCIFGAVTSALTSDRFKVMYVGVAGMLCLIINCVATYINSEYQFQTVYFPFLVAFIWGFIMNYITSWESVSCAKINLGCLQSFSIVRQIQAVAFIGFAISMIFTNNLIDISIFLPVLLGLAVTSIIVMVIFQQRSKKVHLQTQSQ